MRERAKGPPNKKQAWRQSYAFSVREAGQGRLLQGSTKIEPSALGGGKKDKVATRLTISTRTSSFQEQKELKRGGGGEGNSKVWRDRRKRRPTAGPGDLRV